MQGNAGLTLDEDLTRELSTVCRMTYTVDVKTKGDPEHYLLALRGMR
jgi:hypothetical protein